MADTPASLFIDNVKNSLGLERDIDLAKRLRIAKGTVASWRIRGQIPAAAVAKMEKLSGVTMVSAELKFYSTGGAARSLAKIEFFLTLAELFAHADDQERRRLATGFAFTSDEILRTLAERAAKLRQKGMTDEDFLRFRLIVRVHGGASLTSIEEIRAWAENAATELKWLPQSLPQSDD